MSKLRPLFGNRRSELLINFMVSFVDRFVDTDDPDLLEGFRDLFGDESLSFRKVWAGLKGLEREDAIVEAYCQGLKKNGNYTFVGSSIVLDPSANQTYYRLIYATHHLEGMRVFREVEMKAHAEQESIRAELAQVKRIAKTGMADLFEPTVLSSNYDASLVSRYQSKSLDAVQLQLKKAESIPYDRLEQVALSFPLTSATQLKDWLMDWKTQGKLNIEGLKKNQRRPKHSSGHVLRWAKQ